MDVEKKRKSFEFRMSKKVAELTQVVHMLFVRNHEKEMELEAVKVAYEEEIAGVITEAKNSLSAKTSKDAKVRDTKQKDLLALQRKLETEHSEKQKDSDSKVKALETKLADEKKSSQNLRDCLVMLQKELDLARTNFHTEKSAWQQTLKTHEETNCQQQNRLQSLEKSGRDAEARLADLRAELEAKTLRLSSDTQKLQALVEHSKRVKDGLSQRNQELEQEVLNMRREMKRTAMGEQLRSQTQQSNKPREDPYQEAMSDEVDHLRRELLRYKMELLNRDTTYNRVFKDNNTFLVDNRAGLIASLTNSISTSSVQRPTSPQIKSGLPKKSGPMREKTFSYVIGQSYDADMEQSVSNGPQNSTGSRFPQVGGNLVSKSQKLSRPQPPKKLVST